MIAPISNATRTEVAFVKNMENIVATAPNAGRVIVFDRLNMHPSESLVILVARLLGITSALGVKGKSGVLKSLKNRKAFLTDKSRRIIW